MMENFIQQRPNFVPCRKPGCRALTKNMKGYCDKHLNTDFLIADRNRKSASERGYNWQWRKVRDCKLNEAPMCERCGRLAILVHHKDRDPKNNIADNLESLCKPCHYDEHRNELWKSQGRHK